MSEYIFSLTTDSPKFLVNSLQAIAWKQPNDQICGVSVSQLGILFSSEDTTTLQASVLLKPIMFRHYSYMRNTSYEFRINLTSLVYCLNIFVESATNVEIRAREETDLEVNIYDLGSITDCTIRTLHYPNTGHANQSLSDVFSNRDYPEVASFQTQSVIFREMFRFPNEQHYNSVSMSVTIDPEKRTFEVKADGSYGTTRSVMSLDKQSYLQKIDIKLTEPLTACFSVAAMTPVLKAMALSTDTKFLIKSNGMLAITQGIRSSIGSNVETVVEFILQPIEENTFAI